jgi:hypothetical protein
LLNLILAEDKKKGDIALAVASSWVAATLLHGGRTADSALKLPLNFNLREESTCNIIDNPAICKLLKRTKVIVWDECRMVNKKRTRSFRYNSTRFKQQ